MINPGQVPGLDNFNVYLHGSSAGSQYRGNPRLQFDSDFDLLFEPRDPIHLGDIYRSWDGGFPDFEMFDPFLDQLGPKLGLGAMINSLDYDQEVAARIERLARRALRGTPYSGHQLDISVPYRFNDMSSGLRVPASQPYNRTGLFLHSTHPDISPGFRNIGPSQWLKGRNLPLHLGGSALGLILGLGLLPGLSSPQ